MKALKIESGIPVKLTNEAGATEQPEGNALGSLQQNGSALSWIDSLGVRMWEWCEYDGYCQLQVTRKKTTERSLRGGRRIAGILRELGVTEEQARNWHWRPAHDPMTSLPPVLDACCGGRMFWYDKNNSSVIFMDDREVGKGAFKNNWNPNWCVVPDIVADFRAMPFPDNSFSLVVYDPPHLTNGSRNSVINTKYGLLNKETWRQDLVDGFTECWRVLKVGGVLIFKWHLTNIKKLELVRLLPIEPLFGDFTGKSGKTVWMTFLKQ